MDRRGYEEPINAASLDSLLMERLTNWLNLSVNCLGPPSASPSLLNWLLFCYYQFSRAEPSASSNRWVVGGARVCPHLSSGLRGFIVRLLPSVVQIMSTLLLLMLLICRISGAVLIPLGTRTGWGGGLQWGGGREEEGAAGGWKGPASFISSATVHEPCWLQYYFNSSSHLPYYLLIYAHHYGGCSLCDE